MTTAIDQAGDYIRRGWHVVPVLPGEKVPGFVGWPDFKPTPKNIDQFTGSGLANSAPRLSLQELASVVVQPQNGAETHRPTQKWRGNSAVQKRGRRHRLVDAAIRKHGPVAVALLLERLEEDFGDDLRVDARLEHLIDADPRAIALLGGAR